MSWGRNNDAPDVSRIQLMTDPNLFREIVARTIDYRLCGNRAGKTIGR